MKNEHVRDGHVKDAAQDVGGGVTQDVAEDVLGAAKEGDVKFFIVTIAICQVVKLFMVILPIAICQWWNPRQACP